MWGMIKAKHGVRESVDELVRIEHAEVLRRVSAMDASPVVAGVEDLIRALRTAGAALAVASSSPHAAIDLLLEKARLREYFPLTVSADDVKRGKPHPDIFIAAAARLGCAARRCLVVEDSPHGVRGAKAAGMAAVGYANPNSGGQDLAEADLVVADFSPDSIEAVLGLVK
jgi:HAD superfamily hydrolase (TIGR01509 family)